MKHGMGCDGTASTIDFLDNDTLVPFFSEVTNIKESWINRLKWESRINSRDVFRTLSNIDVWNWYLK